MTLTFLALKYTAFVYCGFFLLVCSEVMGLQGLGGHRERRGRGREVKV